MKFKMNQKTLKNINICVIIVGLCLFSMWCGAVINGANVTANTIDLSGLTPEESGGTPAPSTAVETPFVNYAGSNDNYSGGTSAPVVTTPAPTPTNAATTLFDEMQANPKAVSTVQLPFVVGDTESGDNTAGD